MSTDKDIYISNGMFQNMNSVMATPSLGQTMGFRENNKSGNSSILITGLYNLQGVDVYDHNII